MALQTSARSSAAFPYAVGKSDGNPQGRLFPAGISGVDKHTFIQFMLVGKIDAMKEARSLFIGIGRFSGNYLAI
jgi:hypothetical protein